MRDFGDPPDDGRPTLDERIANLPPEPPQRRGQLIQLPPPPPTKYDFRSMADRLRGERERRLAQAALVVPFGIDFLDDVLRGLAPHDLALITAKSGAGKTEFAGMIAENAVRRGRRVLFFALEAEPDEIERRIKYRHLARAYFEVIGNRKLGQWPDYRDWYAGDLDGELASYEHAIEPGLAELGKRLSTVYRGASFSVDDIAAVTQAAAQDVDLVIVDHLHFIDAADDDERAENAALKAITKGLRDLALRVGKPVLVVVHLRKSDRWRPSLMPTLDDIHGSSDVVKIATRVIALAPAPHDDDLPWYLAPTYLKILKDRIAGEQSLIAKIGFDRRQGVYTTGYQLGRVSREKDVEVWKRIDDNRVPQWAKRCEYRGGPELRA